MDEYSTSLASSNAARQSTTTVDGTLTRLAGAILGLHLLTNLLHSGAHAGTNVFLGPVVTTVVIGAVYALPVIGGLFFWRGAVRLGAAVFTAGMGTSLGLGVALHYLVQNPDHVTQVPAGPWHEAFTLTAVAIAVIELAGTVVGLALLWGTTGNEQAQCGSSRITGVPWTGFKPLTRFIYWVSHRWFGVVPASVTVLAHHRGVLAGASAFEMGLDSGDAIDEQLESLAVQKAAMEIDCPFCIDIGAAEAQKLGITTEQLQDLPVYEDSDAFSRVERLVLRYADAMSATPADIPDDLSDKLAAEFDEEALVELTAAIAWENFRGRFNHAFDLQAQGFHE